MRLLETLRQPYPSVDLERSNLERVRSSFFSGLFVVVFLLVFEPFGINNWHSENKVWYLTAFGGVTFSLLLFFHFIVLSLFPGLFKESIWTVGREVLMNLFILLLITLGNFFLGAFLGLFPWSGYALAWSFITVLGIGVFPILFNVLVKYNTAFKKYNQPIEVRERLPTLDKIITLTAENGKDKLDLSKNSLLFLESADNYSKVVFEENGELSSKLLRGSLAAFDKQISDEKICRCHRSFIVNLNLVTNITGNAQGYKVQVGKALELIPIARGYSHLMAKISQ